MPKLRREPVVGTAAQTTSDGVAAVDRALAVLQAFKADRPEMTLSELAIDTGLYKSTILRLINSLLGGGFLERLADGRYRIGPTPFRLGELYRQSTTPDTVILPIMRHLSKESGESVVFYVRAGERMRTCLYRVESPQHAVRYHVREGELLPMNAGTPGLVLLAFSGQKGEPFETIRRTGVYAASGERDPNIAGIAAPVFGANACLIGALAVVGPSSRFEMSFVQHMTGRVQAMAAQATQALGGTVFFQSGINKDERSGP